MVEGKKGEKRHRRFKVPYLFVGMFVLLVIAYVFYRFWLQDTYKAKLEEIRAAGYPATCVELDEWYSIPAGAENAADYFIKATGYFVQWDIEKRERLFFVGYAELPGPNEPIQQDVKELIAEFLEDNKKSLEILSDAAKMENCRFPVNLSSGLSAIMPYLPDMRYEAQMLCLQAVYYVEEKKSQKALESIETALGVANSLSNEPVLVSQLVSIISKSIAVDAVRFSINRTDFNDSQLIVLDRLLADSEDILSIQRGLVGERCFGIENFNLSYSQISSYVVRSVPFVDAVGFAIYKLSGMSEIDKLIYIDFMSKGIDAAGLPLQQRGEAFRDLESKIYQLSRFHIVLRLLEPYFSGVFDTELAGIADIRTARVGIALRRFYLERDRYPDSLSELVGDFLPAVPEDPFDGSDIRYKKFSEGCVVYSVGKDGVDSCATLSELDIEAFGDDITTIISK